MLKKWFENFLDESHCKHKYSFIKMQDMVEQLLVGNKNIGNVKVTGFYSVWREKNTK
ncbi:hypothetical protein [Bacillus cereus group sp. BY105LC]|uniref:hypothetical protein n=1 Tax=Bacillus cereus group sp. BY105LC TaxID=3018088 RepID=UPI0022E5B079|nr:hypothetical protein [Bacillus cereus group sp. BY105LC]MDA1885029.1 hypothetical protein [Bacillus cereus group sp. BY105LC]